MRVLTVRGRLRPIPAVMLLVGALLLASPDARALGAEAGAVHLTPAEEHALVVEALTVALDATRAEGQERAVPSEDLLELAGQADPALAEKWLADVPQARRARGEAAILLGLLRSDPAKGLARVAVTEVDDFTLLVAALVQNATDPVAARALLDRAAAAAGKDDPSNAPASLAMAAALARKLGDPRAPDRVAEAIRALDAYAAQHPVGRAGEGFEAAISTSRLLAGADVLAAAGVAQRITDPRLQDRVLGSVLQNAAPVDPAGAEALLPRIHDDWRRTQSLLWMARRAAKRHPAVAAGWLRRVQLGPDAAPDDWDAWLRTAHAVVASLSDQDPRAAEGLARTMPDPVARAGALLAVAGRLPPAQGAALRSEALELAASGDGRRAPLALAEAVSPKPGEPLTRDFVVRALELLARRTPAGDWEGDIAASQAAAKLALAVSAADPALARDIIEGHAAYRPVPGAPDERRSLSAMCWVAVDPRRALALARELPRAGDDARAQTAMAIARYLLVPPEERARQGFLDLLLGMGDSWWERLQ